MSGALAASLKATALAAVFLACGPVPGADRAAAQEERVEAPPVSSVDFPPQDDSIWYAQRQGLVAKLAARRLAEAPAATETLDLLLQAARLGDALASLRTIVEAHPERIAAAFELLGDHPHDIGNHEERTGERVFGELLTQAEARVADLPAEEAALTAWLLLPMRARQRMAAERRNVWPELLGAFLAEHGDSSLRTLAEVELLVATEPRARILQVLERYVDAHPGTPGAARALFLQGEELQHTMAFHTEQARELSPADRLRRLLAIVEELQSGRYPPSRWVEGAPSLIANFFVPEDADIAAESVDWMIGVFRDLIAQHLDLYERTPAGLPFSLEAIVGGWLGRLHALRGDGVEGVQRTLAAIEAAATGDDAATAAWLRARHYDLARENAPAEMRPELRRKATAALESVAAGDGPFAGRALATLASSRFSRGRFEEALTDFRAYVDTHPHGDWAWVAALRVGQCLQAMGDWDAAESAFRESANRHRSVPLAQVLGHAYAAQAARAAGRLREALAESRRALEGWDLDYGTRYTLYTSVSERTQRATFRSGGDWVDPVGLQDRIATLERSLADPAGAVLEAGRWLLETERWDRSATLLEQTAERHPDSSLLSEARYLAHRARLERALELADIEGPAPDEAAAFTGLEHLARQPWDPAVGVAQIARAAILWQRGETDAAERSMRTALENWQRQQYGQAHLPPDTLPGLAADIREIRNLVFQPLGDGLLGEDDTWNAFEWPEQLPPFLVVDPRISVQLADSSPHAVSAFEPIRNLDSVLFLGEDELDLLRRVMTRLGGTATREPGRIMETPNQPVGPSLSILDLWNRFFPARPGHWSGWVLETYPQISRIEFLDEARTHALAHVTIGYSGTAVLVEKRDGRWTPVRTIGYWIT